MQFENTADFARQLDNNDPLRTFREKFYIPKVNGEESIYFTGNSLGLQPRTAAAHIQQELDDWAALGVEGHFHAKHPWKKYHERFADQLATITGALTTEVVAMNQLTVNLHLLMASFYRPTKQRYRIICEAKAFPSDQYALETQARHHGYDPAEAIIEVHPREDAHSIHHDDILAAISRHADELALVMIGGVNYYTGQVFDMQGITKAAHAAGAYCGFDLAHGVGNVELKLHDWKVDFACWCSYKYLNSGPGGIAGIFVHEQHATNPGFPRLAGWWGNNKETRFQMEKGFDAIPTAEGWQMSNAPVISMAAHKASLDIFEEAGMHRLHEKRRMLAAYSRYLLDELLNRRSAVFTIITPEGVSERGCQLSLLFASKGREAFDELTRQGVIADWREPNVIRIAPVPLYNSFTDIYRFVQIIAQIIG